MTTWSANTTPDDAARLYLSRPTSTADTDVIVQLLTSTVPTLRPDQQDSQKGLQVAVSVCNPVAVNLAVNLASEHNQRTRQETNALVTVVELMGLEPTTPCLQRAS